MAVALVASLRVATCGNGSFGIEPRGCPGPSGQEPLRSCSGSARWPLSNRQSVTRA